MKMADYTIYSEEEYYDRMQLLSIYNATACDCIWEEIAKYRELFCYEFSFRSKRSYITLNRTLFHKMLKIYDLPLFNEETNKFIAYDQNIHCGIKDLILKYIHINQISMSQLFLRFLISDEILLLKLFVIHQFMDDPDFLYLFLHLHKRTGWYDSIMKIEKSSSLNKDGMDLTKGFRDFLDSFYFHSTENVIQLKSTVFAHMDIEELLALYPTCNEKQMNFYLQCASKNHYYTISQYQKMNHVSYETARKAMEHLVELGFYRKLKVGKKFVFTPID